MMQSIPLEDFSSNMKLNSVTTDLDLDDSFKVSSADSSISYEFTGPNIEEDKTLQIMSDINNLCEVLL